MDSPLRLRQQVRPGPLADEDGEDLDEGLIPRLPNDDAKTLYILLRSWLCDEGAMGMAATGGREVRVVQNSTEL